MEKRKINEYIDHTMLKPNAKYSDIKTLVNEAIENNFYSICINPCWVKEAKTLLKNEKVKIVTVIGFPLGTNTMTSKLFEAKEMLDCGVDEIDMVQNIGKLKEGDFDYNLVEESKMAELVHRYNAKLKIIIETCLLTKEEIEKSSEICIKAGADFVKTSTGFSGEGATVQNIKFIKKIVGDKIQIKAAGGIKDFNFANSLIKAGATRLGTSSSLKILEEMNN